MTAIQARARTVTRSQKAAMVVQLLLKDGGDLPLAQLPPDAQARLTKELGSLSMVDKATLEAVIDEFSSELSQVALTAPGSFEAALKSLEGLISAETVTRLRAEAATSGHKDPWVAVLALEPERLAPITEAESPEICAVLLSKLSTEKAAALLGLLPGEKARRIAYAMSKTSNIKPDAINRIGEGLARQYCKVSLSAFNGTPEARVGAILNSSKAATRDDVLEGLISQDKMFGEGVRKAIFTFEDIPARLNALDVPKVVRDVDPGDMVRALAFALAAGGVKEGVASFILDNMSKRMADNLREEIAEAGKIKQDAAEAAEGELIKAIRTLADAEEITLIVEEEEEG